MPAPDALLLISTHCPHCPAMLSALAGLLKRGIIGRLEAVNLEQQPEAGQTLGVRSVPWVRIGRIELAGVHSKTELADWAAKAGSEAGMADWFHMLLKEGQLPRAQALIETDPKLLAAVLPIVGNVDASLNVRLGAGVLLENFAGSDTLRALLPRLGELSQHEDARVRADACHYLGLSGDGVARPWLEARLTDEDADVREIAAESLQVIPGRYQNMEPYFFQGVVLPERAQLSLQFTLGFSHIASRVAGVAKVSVVLNQVAVWIEGGHEWDIFDLRNVVKNLVQSHLDMVGYIKGHAYDLEITRVLNQSRSIDYVFGIDIPCLAERGKSLDLNAELIKLRDKTIGPNGVFMSRCFSDLASAMKHADDTGFYCYRAIESLRHHCAAVHGLSSSEKSTQWKKFRGVAACDENMLRDIKLAADPLRHGEASGITSDDRAALFMNTWNVVDGYLKNI